MKTKRKLLVMLGAAMLGSCSISSPQVDYGNISEESTVVTLAVQDLKDCVKKVPNIGSNRFELLIDSNLKSGEFGYSIETNGNVIFRAGDEMGVTHAVYTYLEQLGYTFDITGISAPDKWNISFTAPFDTIIRPTIRWRGIRQHVNFPMDISSYEINEAKEYIDQLVRLRLNKLTIHSYPGQWYETMIGDSLALAGHYFYGNKHYMYDNSFLQQKVSGNDSLFCISEAEKLRYKPEENSSFALSWMKELISYAKERGFYVQFSFEPRITTIEQAVFTVKDILRTYPDIDALELITEETGGWGAACTRKETIATLNKYFDQSVATDSVVNAPIKDRQSDLNALYTEVGVIVQAINKLKQDSVKYPELKLGIYCTIPQYAEGAYRLARLALPTTNICLMSSHGSEGTSKALPVIVKTAEDKKYTEIYSWIELDGLMYLYQNSISGNEKMMHWLTESSEKPVKSILFNHWRTAENRTSARFAAESTLNGDLSSVKFYQTYANRFSINDSKLYTEAMQLINQADSFSTKKLGNIGFCWMGAWRNGGSYTWMSKDNIHYARELYMKAGDKLTALLKQCEKDSTSYDYLSLICNRVLCSILYLDAFYEAVNIQKVSDEKHHTDESKSYVRNVCDKALLIFEQYMSKHAEMLVDRGCEGTLVSIWNAPIRGLKIYREKLGGVPMDGPSSLEAVDAPPLPFVY